MNITIKGKKFSEAEVMPPHLRRLNEKIDWLDPSLSFRAIAETVYEAHYDGRRGFVEANPESSFGALLRAGVQTIANDYYQQLPKTYDKYCQIGTSDKYQEVYPPLFGARPARRVGHGLAAQESEVIGDDNVLTNLQFGGMESFEESLVEDDQSGQIRQRAKDLGEGYNTTENFYAARRFIGTAGSLADLAVEASKFATTDVTGTSRAVWSKVLYGAAVGNRLQTFAALDGAKLKNAKAIARSARDPLNVKIVVNCDTLLVSSMDEDNAVVLTGRDLKGNQVSPWFPMVPGISTDTASTAPGGGVGSAYAANPFGMGLQPVVENYLPAWAWAIGVKGKGLLMQTRKAPEVFQEVPNSGMHFTNREVRYAVFGRFECDWIGNRHWVLGNPGSGETVDGDAGAAGAF